MPPEVSDRAQLIDTRNSNGPLGGPSLAANATRTFAVAGPSRVAKSESARGDRAVFDAGLEPVVLVQPAGDAPDHLLDRPP